MIITEKKLDETDRKIATKIGEEITLICEKRRPLQRIRQPFYKTRYLYIIQSSIGGPVKIGISEEVNERVRQLQHGSPFELVAIRTMAFDSTTFSAHDVEKCLHNELKGFKVRGEWFNERVINILDFMADKFQFDFYETFGKMILNDFNRQRSTGS